MNKKLDHVKPVHRVTGHGFEGGGFRFIVVDGWEFTAQEVAELVLTAALEKDNASPTE